MIEVFKEENSIVAGGGTAYYKKEPYTVTDDFGNSKELFRKVYVSLEEYQAKIEEYQAKKEEAQAIVEAIANL